MEERLPLCVSLPPLLVLSLSLSLTLSPFSHTLFLHAKSLASRTQPYIVNSPRQLQEKPFKCFLTGSSIKL